MTGSKRDGWGIVGAGCAGLSLAVHLVEAGFRKPLHLFDRRRRFDSDRTWCAFRVHAHRFAACVDTRWHQVAVRAHGHIVHKQLKAHPYEHIAAGTFYEEALSVLRAADNVHLHLGSDVTHVSARAIDARDEGSTHRHSFERVFDSRFGERELAYMLKGEGLAQCFAGTFVRTEAPRFDPTCAILMDFDVHEDVALQSRRGRANREMQFRYVLPFDAHTALVEDTFFAKNVRPAGADLDTWLSSLGPHEVLSREQGVLPMSTQVPPSEPGVIPIGLRAGAAKPSSGYAFDFIQRHSQALVRDVHASVPRPPTARFLDDSLLDELRAAPETGPALFRRLFQRNPADRVARFLMEGSSRLDEVALMATVPSWRLIRGGALWPYRRVQGGGF